MIRKTCVKIQTLIVILYIFQVLSCVTTTPGNMPQAGTIWFLPKKAETEVDKSFTLEIHANTGNQKVAAYAFHLRYPPKNVEIDTDKGTNGVEPGPDGFLIAVNASEPGTLYIGGYDIHGKGPDNDLHLLTTHWKGLAAGNIVVFAKIMNLNDEKTHVIGTPKGNEAEVTIR